MELDYSKTARVAMVWPEQLKDLVRDKVGPRGLTEFTIDAVCAALGITQDADPIMCVCGAELDSDECKTRAHLSGAQPKVELTKVKSDPEPVQTPVEDYPAADATGVPFEEPVEDPWQPEEDIPLHQIAQEVKEKVEIDQTASSGPRDDLFAKIMAKTGGELDPGFGSLKVASEIAQPEPKAQDEICGNCGDVLVDGECWSCS